MSQKIFLTHSVHLFAQTASTIAVGAFLCFLPPQDAAAEESQITREGADGTLTISLKDPVAPAVTFTSPTVTQISSFYLPDPARLVVDIPKENPGAWGDTIHTPQSDLVQRVRIGRHPNKIRVVFDLSQEVKPEVEEHETDGVVALSFGATPVPANTLATQIAQEPEEVRASLDIDVAPQEIISNTLRSIQFVRLSPSDTKAVKITLDEKTPFTLEKQQEDTFALSIPNTTFADASLTHPYFPPQGFAGFTSIQAESLAGETTVLIGVEPGTRLLALPKAGSIWVRAVE